MWCKWLFGGMHNSQTLVGSADFPSSDTLSSPDNGHNSPHKRHRHLGKKIPTWQFYPPIQCNKFDNVSHSKPALLERYLAMWRLCVNYRELWKLAGFNKFLFCSIFSMKPTEFLFSTFKHFFWNDPRWQTINKNANQGIGSTTKQSGFVQSYDN